MWTIADLEDLEDLVNISELRRALEVYRVN